MPEPSEEKEKVSASSIVLSPQANPSPFTGLRLLPILTTSTADLVQDFFEPLLLRSLSYDRGVGFFSAGLDTNQCGWSSRIGPQWWSCSLSSPEDNSAQQ